IACLIAGRFGSGSSFAASAGDCFAAARHYRGLRSSGRAGPFGTGRAVVRGRGGVNDPRCSTLPPALRPPEDDQDRLPLAADRGGPPAGLVTELERRGSTPA